MHAVHTCTFAFSTLLIKCGICSYSQRKQNVFEIVFSASGISISLTFVVLWELIRQFDKGPGRDVVRFSLVLVIRRAELHLRFRERQCHGRSAHDFTANCCSHVDDAPLCLCFFFAIVSKGVDTM